MKLTIWNDRFLLGMEQVDENHRRLFKLLNIIQEQFDEEAPVENLIVLLDALISLSTFHFGYEEQWMAEIRFPEISEHEKEHGFFIANVSDIKRSYSRTRNANVELLQFLDHWISHHFNDTNESLKFFLSKGLPRR